MTYKDICEQLFAGFIHKEASYPLTSGEREAINQALIGIKSIKQAEFNEKYPFQVWYAIKGAAAMQLATAFEDYGPARAYLLNLEGIGIVDAAEMRCMTDKAAYERDAHQRLMEKNAKLAALDAAGGVPSTPAAEAMAVDAALEKLAQSELGVARRAIDASTPAEPGTTLDAPELADSPAVVEVAGEDFPPYSKQAWPAKVRASSAENADKLLFAQRIGRAKRKSGQVWLNIYLDFVTTHDTVEEAVAEQSGADILISRKVVNWTGGEFDNEAVATGTTTDFYDATAVDQGETMLGVDYAMKGADKSVFTVRYYAKPDGRRVSAHFTDQFAADLFRDAIQSELMPEPYPQ